MKQSSNLMRLRNADGYLNRVDPAKEQSDLSLSVCSDLSVSILRMDGYLGALHPFQQYFSHIRMMKGWT